VACEIDVGPHQQPILHFVLPRLLLNGGLFSLAAGPTAARRRRLAIAH
jgi:hypothetical protein